MPPPPPPPPPLLSPPPPPLPVGPDAKSQLPVVQSGDRNALLASIRQGAKLRSTTTNDRSSPLINGKSPNNSNSVGTNKQSSSNNCHSSSAPMALGGLFAHGMPKLRPTNQSFLQGGTYKSQLNPRPSVNSEKFSKTTSLTLNKQKVTSKVNDCIQDTSRNSNSDSGAQMYTLPHSGKKFPFQHEPQSASVSAVPPPPPPPSNRKPTFQSGTVSKSNAVRHLLQKNEEFQLGGSEPNLSIDCSKPRSSSKPHPPPKLLQASSASSSPVKSNVDLKYRSYEDTDIPKKLEVRREDPNSFTLGPKIHNNRSEPSNLNKISQNGTSQHPVAPVRQHNRRERPVKPSTAPPPLPVRTLESSLHQNSVWQASHVARDPPPAPPSMPPPPPPPRVFQQDPPVVNGRAVPINVPVRNETLPKVGGASDFESRFKFHKGSELPKPDAFLNKKKLYYSKLASQRPQHKRRARQPPPQAPPPPPPIQTK